MIKWTLRERLVLLFWDGVELVQGLVGFAIFFAFLIFLVYLLDGFRTPGEKAEDHYLDTEACVLYDAENLDEARECFYDGYGEL